MIFIGYFKNNKASSFIIHSHYNNHHEITNEVVKSISDINDGVDVSEIMKELIEKSKSFRWCSSYEKNIGILLINDKFESGVTEYDSLIAKYKSKLRNNLLDDLGIY